ncbi:MAG: hypothetical protein ABII09_09195 [Planctomycetota bacterium]
MAKIDLSKLKDIVKWLGVLRPYASLLWPGVIVLAGIVVLTAALLLGSGLKNKVNRQSMPMASRVRAMLNSALALRQAEEEKKYEDTYEQDANLISRLAIQTTQRELLDYDIFPQPKDTSAMLFTRFANRFRQRIENLVTKVKGGDCPSEEELNASLQKVGGAASIYTRGVPSASGASDKSIIIEELCQQRAKAAGVYANPKTISGYDFWNQYQYSSLEDSVKDCWFWQLGYWIIEDVFSTVEKMNAGSSSVSTSAVKRVMRVGFETPEKLLSGKSDEASQEKLKYVVKPEDQLTVSLTNRLSNESIDIVHFGVVVVVSANAAIPFMEELCSEKEHRFAGYTGEAPVQAFKHNQITILESRVTSVSPESQEHLRYRYGQDPAVEIEMVCEYIFNKKGYEPIYPEALKEKKEPTMTYEQQ